MPARVCRKCANASEGTEELCQGLLDEYKRDFSNCQQDTTEIEGKAYSRVCCDSADAALEQTCVACPSSCGGYLLDFQHIYNWVCPRNQENDAVCCSDSGKDIQPCMSCSYKLGESNERCKDVLKTFSSVCATEGEYTEAEANGYVYLRRCCAGKSTGLTAGQKAGIAIGVILAAGVVAAAVWYFVFYKAGKKVVAAAAPAAVAA